MTHGNTKNPKKLNLEKLEKMTKIVFEKSDFDGHFR